MIDEHELQNDEVSRRDKQPVFDFLLKLPERYLAEDSDLMGNLNTGCKES